MVCNYSMQFLYFFFVTFFSQSLLLIVIFFLFFFWHFFLIYFLFKLVFREFIILVILCISFPILSLSLISFSLCPSSVSLSLFQLHSPICHCLYFYVKHCFVCVTLLSKDFYNTISFVFLSDLKIFVVCFV